MAKFKVGDRVRFLGSHATNAVEGAEAVVEGLDSTWLRVKWDRMDPRVGTQMDGDYFPEKFEVIPPPRTAIVIAAENGSRALAKSPSVHPDVDAALAWATHLAETVGGKFFVFEAVGAAEAPKVDVKVTRY